MSTSTRNASRSGRSRRSERRPPKPVRTAVLAGALAMALGLASLSPAWANTCDSITGPEHITSAAWVDQTAARNALLQTGHGQFSIRARDGKSLRVFSYRPAGFDPHRGRIWFVLHGSQRDADHYAQLAAPSADRYGTLVIAIEFNSTHYPTSEHYSLGIASSGTPDWRAHRDGRLLEPEAFAFNEIERLFESVRDMLGGSQGGYYLFGHSAGAQFVHRMLSFVPCARVKGAVAANAGWYTLPIEDGRSGFRLPYSLFGLPPGLVDQRALFSAPLTIMLGSDDTSLALHDSSLRSTAGAMEQGPHRLARGENYFEVGRQTAAELGIPFRWNLQQVPNVGHNARRMLPPAAHVLFEQAYSGDMAASSGPVPASAKSPSLAQSPPGRSPSRADVGPDQ